MDFSTIYDFVFKLDKRLLLLEKDSQYLQEQIDKVDSNRDTRYIELKSEMSLLKADFESLRKSLKNCLLQLMDVSDDIKNSVKKDQLQQLSDRIDEIKFEEYITKIELKKGLS